MKTKIFTGKEDLIQAARIINQGGLVAFPTETVYGLGADALNEEAVGKIFQAKGRPGDNPLIVHISRPSEIGQLTSKLSADLVALIDQFWPGPLTFIVKKKPEVPRITTGGLDTVAVRMPDNPLALELISRAGTPIAAPSANLSGRPSPTKASHVREDLDGLIDAIVFGEDCRVGIESTVLDMSQGTPRILRPGVITAEQIEAVIHRKVALDSSLLTENKEEGSLEGQKEDSSAPRAPGMKYTHYAPRAEMIVVEGPRHKVKEEIERLKKVNEKIGNDVGVILFEEQAFIEAAHDFFAKLREMDEKGKDIIFAGALSYRDGVGFAVMNRMLKSAGYNIVRV